jgi:hypothetical protein
MKVVFCVVLFKEKKEASFLRTHTICPRSASRCLGCVVVCFINWVAVVGRVLACVLVQTYLVIALFQALKNPKLVYL